MSISYAITVCNELKELMNLIQKLQPFIRDEDELVVLFDTQNGSDEVRDYLNYINISFEFENISFHRIFHHLDNDFASFKNYLKEHCSKEYIFFIDADEFPSDNILQFLPMIISNTPVDVFLIPRVNTVEGLTNEHIQKWGWRLDEFNRVNWPDFQMRIVKNIPELKWEGKVHEKITGHKTISQFPFENEDWCLFHPKTIERQERQNNFYNEL